MAAADKKAEGAEKNIDGQEIRYDAVPGYRPVFFLLLTLAGAYLAYVFIIASHG